MSGSPSGFKIVLCADTLHSDFLRWARIPGPGSTTSCTRTAAAVSTRDRELALLAKAFQKKNVQHEIRLLHRHVARKPATGSRVAQEGVGARQGKSKNRIDFGGRRLRPLQTEWDEIRKLLRIWA